MEVKSKHVFITLPRSLFWPRRLACAMRSLAIVFTIVQSFFFSPSFALICHIEPGPICHVEPGPICHIEPGPICQFEPGPICHIEPGPICQIESVFLLFTASVRSRPPGPPAVPGVLIHIVKRGDGCSIFVCVNSLKVSMTGLYIFHVWSIHIPCV